MEIENRIAALETQMVDLANQADYAGLKQLEVSLAAEKATLSETTSIPKTTNNDPFVIENDCIIGRDPFKWEVYNTADSGYVPPTNTPTKQEEQYSCKIVSSKSGKFAYWESTETYPCYESVWGSLASTIQTFFVGFNFDVMSLPNSACIVSKAIPLYDVCQTIPISAFKIVLARGSVSGIA